MSEQQKENMRFWVEVFIGVMIGALIPIGLSINAKIDNLQAEMMKTNQRTVVIETWKAKIDDHENRIRILERQQ